MFLVSLCQAANFRVEIEEEEEGVLLIRPSGQIDEDVNFGELLEFLSQEGNESRPIVFDLGHISRINSCGIREWLLFMERIKNDRSYSLANVNVSFIEQSNMIPDLLGKKGTKINSFQAPFYCAECDSSYTFTVNTKDIGSADNIQLPEFKCPKDTAILDFDAIEDEYFHFLKYMQS